MDEPPATPVANLAYLVAVRLDGRELYFLWSTGDDDSSLLQDATGATAAFDSEAAACAEAASHGLLVSSNETARYDLDRKLLWAAAPDPTSIEPVAMLNAINVLDDAVLPISLRDGMRGDESEQLAYDKLFWSNNLPSVTPDSQRFDPTWTEADAAAISRMLVRGVDHLRRNLRLQEDAR